VYTAPTSPVLHGWCPLKPDCGALACQPALPYPRAQVPRLALGVRLQFSQQKEEESSTSGGEPQHSWQNAERLAAVCRFVTPVIIYYVFIINLYTSPIVWYELCVQGVCLSAIIDWEFMFPLENRLTLFLVHIYWYDVTKNRVGLNLRLKNRVSRWCNG